jgi:hypothetical protein
MASRWRISAPSVSTECCCPQPELEPLLSPLAGWYLGTSLDGTNLEESRQAARRLNHFPSRWARPLLAAPAENWDLYAGAIPNLVFDLPPPWRGLSGEEESALLSDQTRRSGRPAAIAVGLATMPPQRLALQLDEAARSVGAPSVGDYGWHVTYLQAFRSLQVNPRAMVMRSRRSLLSGRAEDERRALGLSVLNRALGVVAPLIAESRSPQPIHVRGSDYQAVHFAGARRDLVIATSNHAVGGADGERLEIALPPWRPGQHAWRIGDFAAEQLPVRFESGGPRVVIESPDLVEVVVLSDDASQGGRLAERLRGAAATAAYDRWQLASELLMHARNDWELAVASGLVPRAALPAGTLASAANTLANAQPLLHAGEFAATHRAASAADRQARFSLARLDHQLVPPGSIAEGLLARGIPGAVPVQLAWIPILEDPRWSPNLLRGGRFDDTDSLQQSGWQVGRRIESIASSTVEIREGASEGGRCLRIEVVGRGDDSLPGGYAGTAVSVRSAAVELPRGSWVRIDARVRTLGFGAPHHGLLIYDSEGGSELGTLVRGAAQWRTVRLHRLVTSERPLRVTFEALGAGEARIEQVQVRLWQPERSPPPVPRPLTAAQSREGQPR